MRRQTNQYKEKQLKKIKGLYNTHTLRHVLESKPGGRFPLKIGSICKTKKYGKQGNLKRNPKSKNIYSPSGQLI